MYHNVPNNCSLISVLDRVPQRLRFLQAEHERRLPAHLLRVVPVTIRQRVRHLLVRRRGEAELLFLLLLQVA